MSMLSPKYVMALQAAIVEAEKVAATLARQRTEYIKAYAGRHALLDENVLPSPIPLLYTTIAIYIAQLVAQHPAAMVTSKYRPYRPFAKTMEAHLEGKIRELDMRGILRSGVFDAMLGQAVFYTGLHRTGEVDINGSSYDVASSYISLVSNQSYVIDPECRKREEALFEGHRMELPLEYCQDAYDHADKLTPSAEAYGQVSEDDKTNAQLRGERRDLEEMCQFHAVWLPKYDNVIAYIPIEGQGDQPLKIMDYDGPDDGPYDMLGFMPMSGSPFPVPPAAVWSDLDAMVNQLARTFADQAKEMKKLLAYEAGFEDDADRILKAPNMAALKVSDITKLKEFTFGEPSQMLQPLISWLMSVGSTMMGNTDLLGGLSASADSATEAGLMQVNAGVKMSDMRGQVEAVTANLLKKVAYHEFTDPLLDSTVYQTIRGTDIELSTRLTPDTIEGRYFDYIFKIQPYSMAPKNPEKNAMQILQWVTQGIFPLLNLDPQLAEQVNSEALIKAMGQGMGVDNVDEFFETRRTAPATGGLPESGGQGNFAVSPSSSLADQTSQIMAQQLGAKMPGMNAGQVPSNMSREAVSAAAGA